MNERYLLGTRNAQYLSTGIIAVNGLPYFNPACIAEYLAYVLETAPRPVSRRQIDSITGDLVERLLAAAFDAEERGKVA